VRTRAIERRLKGVEELPPGEPTLFDVAGPRDDSMP
jgi:hypothetical protein